jgi:hypothetical protein
LNPRHKDFQSFALPTELRHREGSVSDFETGHKTSQI